MTRPLALQAGLAINAVAAAAAAIVLLVSPATIPAIAGIPLASSTDFLAYLLGAAELALAIVAGLAFRGSRDLVRAAVIALVAMHAASAATGILVVIHGASMVIAWNAAARLGVIALLAFGWWQWSLRSAQSDE